MMKRLQVGKAGVGLAVALVLALTACGGGEPEERAFELAIQEQSLVQEESVLQVKQDDMVTIVVTADEHVSFHLHGYDIEQEAKPGKPATLEFTANATGSFPFTIHIGAEEDHAHGQEGDGCVAEIPAGIASPVVRVTASPADEPGHMHVVVELENFVLGGEGTGADPLVGHWHLYIDGDSAGMYTQPEATVSVVEAGEHHFMVNLADPQHCEYDVHAMTTVIVEEGSTDGEEEREEDEEEIELGRLEVQPR